MEKDIWCEGKCDTEDAHFHDDGNKKIYKDNDGKTYICDKHHYSCIICDKIIQVG